MNNITFQTPVCHMKNFSNLFIELTAKNCNLRCKNCYIDFPLTKSVKDFISLDTVKKALSDTKEEPIECIYLTGAEPMTHPDFNQILRMCLKRSNVCIFTNGTFINEKKVRFLKRVEDESTNEIIFKLSIDHYNELKNDETRTRGSYRTTLYAIKNLVKYGFNPILSITNYYNEDKNTLIDEFKKVCQNIGFNAQNNNFTINEFINKNSKEEFEIHSWKSTDCEFGRIITTKGVYCCPLLANDHRGRCGSNFSDFARHNTLETSYCSVCAKNSHAMFSIDYNLFK